MSFDINTFLGKDINIVRENNIKEKKKLFDILYDLNRYCNKLKFTFPLREYEYKKLFVAGLYCKIMQSYNSIIILSSYGLESDSKVILRTLVEASFNISAIINEKEFFDKYIKKVDYEQYQLLNRIKQNKDIFTDELVNTINLEEFCELKEIIKTVKKEDYYIFRIAKLAKMKDVYLYVYSNLSSDVHSNARVIQEFFDIEEDKVLSINSLPKFEKQDYVLSTAAIVLIRVLKAINYFYDLGVIKEIELFDEAMKPYFQGA